MKKYKHSHNENRGLDFDSFLMALSEVHFFTELELTHKEKVSTLSAQLITALMNHVGLLPVQDPSITAAEDVNDIDSRLGVYEHYYDLISFHM